MCGETYVGRLCKRGHDNGSGGTIRLKSNWNCIECMREYRRDKAEHIAITTRAYRVENAESTRETQRTYQQKNRKKLSQNRKEYRRKNAQHIRAVQATYRHTNKERRNEYYRVWRSKNSAQVTHHISLRRTRKVQATPKWVDLSSILAVYIEAKRLTKETGVQYHVDHIVPLKSPVVCGLHVPWNLQIIPAAENLKKHNRMEIL
jgi:hypothetical protein